MLRRMTFAGLLTVAAALLWGSDLVRIGAEEGLQLCLYSVLPSLFPFFVLSSLLLSLGFAESLGRLLFPVMNGLFHLGGNGASALALGLIAGYPSGARAVSRLYEDGLCGKEEAEHLLAHTTHSLNDIGNLIGFSSPSYFSQAFRKSQGISPIDYRKSARGM